MTWGRVHIDTPAWVGPVVMAGLLLAACALAAWQDQGDLPPAVDTRAQGEVTRSGALPDLR